MDLQLYIPQDRLRALAQGLDLPTHSQGAALLADISGFTALTESLRREHGERRGIEALSHSVNAVYDALIGEVERWGGSVIGFAGDAITCWFDRGSGPPAPRAAHCALALQGAMQQFPGLSMKVAVASGAARRCAAGDSGIHLIDVLAGEPLTRVATAEHLARAGEVLIDAATTAALGLALPATRQAPSGEGFAVLDALPPQHAATPPPPLPPVAPVDPEVLRPWVLPFVFDRVTAGQALFATDLRPASALFVRFAGLDVDHSEQALQDLALLVGKTQRAMQRHGGVVLELTLTEQGCCLYCSFGAAQVHEDDAARALRAALAVRQLVAGSGCAVHIGLSSGTMRVGGYGGATRQSFGAIGDDVNTAARLMGQAQPGEILISGRVRHTVDGEFSLEARAPIPMKGKAEPMPVFAVLGVEQQRAIRLQEPQSDLPLVGREAEMALIAADLAAALRGQGRVLGITAEAGMGKSRLVAEGVRLARRSGALGYGGACQLDGVHTPYLVWRPIWAAFFDLDPALPQRRQVRAIESALQERAPEHAEAWPLLGSVLGQDWPDNDFTRALQPRDRKALLETVLLRCLESAALEATADGMALLLVLEDLHAADPLSLDLLLRVARAVPAWPVLVLLSWRPLSPGSADPLAAPATLPHGRQIELDGLSAPQAEQVIRAKLAALYPERLGAVPPALIERLSARAQGNPFYLEELLNYLHDRGIDPRDATAVQTLELPASLHSLVLSRIDQLRAPQQLTLKVASIIGRVLRATDLPGYYPPLGEPEAVKAELRELDRLGFTPMHAPEPELSYLFKHLVTLEAAYECMAYSTRVELHARYARFLEDRYPDQRSLLAPHLAHHWACAQQFDKSCVYQRIAGEQAAARFANDEALACFGRALQWLPPTAGAERFELLLQRESLLDLLGRHDERRADLAELQRLAAELPEPARLQAQVAVRRAKLEIDLGDYAAARASTQAAIDTLLTLATPGPDLVDAWLLQARALFFAGQAREAQPQLEQALALAQALGYQRGEYNVLSQMGLLHWNRGDYDAADEWLARSVALIRQVGDLRRQTDILNNLGVVAKARTRFAQALAHYEAALDIARRIGDRSGQAMLFNNMGNVCLESGDFHRAGVHTDSAARIYAELNEPAQHGMALLNRAEARRQLGQYAAAQALSQQALALLRASGNRRGEAIVLDNLGLVALAQGDPGRALQCATEALSVAREINVRALEAGILVHQGRALCAAGQGPQALAALQAAAALAAELGAERTALQAQAALAEWQLAAPGPDAAALVAGPLAPLVGLLQAPDDPAAAGLPMWVLQAAHAALQAAGDARAAAVLARARQELQRRSDRIQDPASRRDFLNVSEHRSLMST